MKTQALIKRKVVMRIIVPIVLVIVIFSSLSIADSAISKRRESTFIMNKLPPIIGIDFIIISEKYTTLDGRNYTMKFLQINYVFEYAYLGSTFTLEFRKNSSSLGVPLYSFGRTPPQTDQIFLNSTYENGMEMNRNSFFNDWSEIFTIILIEHCTVYYQVIYNHLFEYNFEYFIDNYSLLTI